MTDVIVYLKAPVAGQVKTRLQSRYTPEQAADLYRAFIRDTFATTQKIDADRFSAHYDGQGDVVDDLVPNGWNVVAQAQGDLGSRMLHSLRHAIGSGASRVILIGTDIPSLPAAHLSAALSRLEQADVVLGPTSDGGFYLIGTRVELPDILGEVEWSSPHTFEQTAGAIQTARHTLSLIPPWSDIDTPTDLDLILQDHKAPLTHTRAAVEAIAG
ncbi:TPA: hypothetical protein DCE37_24960 [Candidatus Latescibacteria bacterium]|nr:hypothetical protein [Candidatus Latescibacterota bacterium]|tara:strand:- start:120 stop:761 length:642 start_codon:yes stop_codon:yes gene_type:complete